MSNVIFLQFPTALLGRWRSEDDYNSAEYEIVVEGGGLKITAVDANDGEHFEVSGVKFDRETIMFDTLMPSTGRIAHLALKAIPGSQRATLTLTFTDTIELTRPVSDDLLPGLREIGWRNWDPIGLLAAGEQWHEKSFADEYDDYLRKVAADFRAGGSLAQAVEYLLRIEREHMVLGVRSGQEKRAEATAQAIQLYVASSAHVEGMYDGYVPASDFLVKAANGEVPLTGTEFAEQNLRLLIGYTSDADTSNRDWATLLLAGLEIDTPTVREALLKATQDCDASVRAEALLGLAERDSVLALPLVLRELERSECGYGTFQAAHAIANPSLLSGLRKWLGKGSTPWINDEINDAIAACEAALASN
ncbi:hypothetical protein SAMN05216304_105176 [Bosea sp. OK403]|uniref:hypothetical protein n=1 Tax=Bosea sp. OK403 TaxID=1855286 RepID=UPI0008EC0057|nr:hypothetical protein [Bosea sp. OK403]SFJ18295.1 hypothetical protein SAMN05216304_105176 [Bosea sp. OK403]